MEAIKYFIYFSVSIFLMMLNFTPAHSQICPPLDKILGNDTLICPDGAMYLDAGVAISYLWSDGSTESNLLITLPGEYTVTVVDECDNSYTDTITVALAENPAFNVNVPVQDYFCKGELVNLIAEAVEPTGTIDYKWVTNNSTDASILVDTTGDYSVVATNEYGCQTTRDVAIEFQFPYQKDKILLSSYSIEDDKFFIVWSATPNKRSKDYSILSGITLSNLFDSRSFDESNLMIDYLTDPHLGSNYYNIRLTDSCNNLSNLRIEDTHKTMYLSTSETDNGNILLIWERYIGFDYENYYVYKGTDKNNLALIDSVKNRLLDKAIYLDEDVEPGMTYYYQIKVKTPQAIYLNSTAKKVGSGPFVHSLSNLEENRLKGTGINSFSYLENNLKVYPNPYNDHTTISYSIEQPSKLKIEIFDIMGKKVDCLFVGDKPAGDYELSYSPKTENAVSGIYYLRFELEGYTVLTKMLIQN